MTTRRIHLHCPDSSCSSGDLLLLPCRIHHDGPAPVSQFFSPTEASAAANNENKGESEKIAYFRGRKLLGMALRLPKGYTGIVYKSAPAQTVPVVRDVSQKRSKAEGPAAEEEPLETEELEELSTWTPLHRFSTLIDFGNNAVTESKFSEWLALSDAIHSQAN